MEELVKKIKQISKLHKDFNERISVERPNPINLTRVQVNHLFEDKKLKVDFFDYLNHYYQKLRVFVNTQILESIDTEFRIKERDSLSYKLERYYFGKEDGKIPLQKCINDILGFRIITDEKLFDSQEFTAICEELKEKKIIYHFYPRTDGDYRAIHMYFKSGSNEYIPWELQIWYHKDERANRESHSRHKLNYLYGRWENV